MASLQSSLVGLKVLMGERGMVDGAEVALLLKLEKALAVREDYAVEEERAGSEKVRKFDKEAIRGMILSRNMGVSYEKIGAKYGCVGMMVRNVVRGNVYRDVVAELKAEGVAWSGN